MPEEAKQKDPDRVLKGVLVGVVVIAILVLVGFLMFLGQANMAGQAVNILGEIRMGQVESMNETEFDSREYCSATVATSGKETAIFLYNCE